MKRRSAAITIVPGEKLARPPGPFVLQPEPAPHAPQFSPSAFDAVYLRRWWIAGGVIAAMVAAWGISPLIPPLYQASALLEVDRKRIAAVVGELQSDPVVRPAFDKFHLAAADRSNLTVTGPTAKQRIRITFRHSDPNVAAGVANWIAKTYTDQFHPGDSLNPTTELNKARAAQEQSSKALADFNGKNGGADPEGDLKKLGARLLELNKAYAAAEKVLAAAKDEPAAREAQKRLDDLNAAYVAAKGRTDELPARAAEHERLRVRAEGDRAVYDALAKTAAPENTSAPVRIAGLAVPPTRPVRPNVPLYLAIALLGSLLVGCAAAIAIDPRSTILETREQLRATPGLKDVTALPAVHNWRQREGFAMFSIEAQEGKPGDRAITRFREGIRNLSRGLGSAGVIAVVSPGPQEGRSRIASEIARAFAAEGRKTLLIDANLRAPVLHALQFSAGPRLGLSSALTGNSDWSDTVMPASNPNEPDILPSGAPDARCPALIDSTLHGIVEEASQVYSVVVLDSPAFLQFPESLAIANVADAVVAIGRAGTTGVQGFEEMLSYLRRINVPVAATILNSAPSLE